VIPPSAETTAGPSAAAEARDGTGHDLADGPVQSREDMVARAIAGWQRDLAEVGGRNTLLWYRDLPSGTLDLSNAHPGGLAMLLAGRPTKLSDLFREATVLREARRRARAVRHKTVELAEERGIVAGYLAVGMATWQVPGPSRQPAAPVLLRSCALRPRGAEQEDFEIDLDGQVDLNPALDHYLRSLHGIEVDAAAIAGLATVRGTFDAQPAFAALSDECAAVQGFAITRRLVVGTFSTAKLPMVADLAAQAGALAGHDVVAALAGDPGARAALGAPAPAREPDGDPRGEYLVLDADSAQQEVVEAVRAGGSLVVEGAPGTGKTQTIANLVAALAADGKRVLVVAEKRAALEGLLARLDSVGLPDLVLDQDESAVGGRRAADEIEGALARLGETGNAGDVPADPGYDVLEARRSALREHVVGLHERREPWGVSAYDAQLALVRLSQRDTGPAPSSTVRIRDVALRHLTPGRLDDLRSRLLDVAAKDAWSLAGSIESDPWYGAYVPSEQEAATAHEMVSRLSSGVLTATRRLMGDALHDVGLPSGRSVADWAKSLRLLTGVRQTLEVFRPEVFEVPLGELSAATASNAYRHTHEVAMGAWSRRRLRAQARQLLRPGPAPADLHEQLRIAQEQRVAWRDLSGGGARPQVPADLDEAGRAYAALEADLSWLAERLGGTAAGADLAGMALDDLQRRLAALAARRDRLDILPVVVDQLSELNGAGLGPIVGDLARRRVPSGEVSAELDHVWWASVLDEIGRIDPRYGAHDGDRLREIRSDYVAADRANLSATAERVRGAASERLRAVVARTPQAATLLRVEGQPARRRALREVLPAAAELLTAVKPCWAMSPLVVASVLPPGRWFDVVVFDEASQLAVAEAVAAIARAAQVVVVGDRAQLPPAPFSTSATDEPAPVGQEASPAAMSILDALSSCLPVHRLATDYRSRDERLISFANAEPYAGSLSTFPGTGDGEVVDLVVVDGVGPVEPGLESIETTPAEVDQVVDLVLLHARTRPQESLGVVTLSSRHAEAIGEALSARLERQPEALGFFADDRVERFFVKAVERVQGDVRDAVILSVGYGRTQHGRVLHGFGSLAGEEGPRRLNVALTRARSRMTIVSCFRAEDLDSERLKSPGAVMLRDALTYAEAPHLPRPVVSGADPLLAGLAHRLRAEGLTVRENLGDSAYPLELAVDDPRRPGHGLVAVETDGPKYAAVVGTRERDRLRQEQFERLGWRYVRLWSTDLFRDSDAELQRVMALLGHAPEPEPVPGPGPGPAPGPESGTPSGSPVDPPARETTASGPAASPAPVMEQTRDDTDLGWGERRGDTEHERWLAEQRPPHWE
jgi:hypothetical protein